jgi:hypothetical protein
VIAPSNHCEVALCKRSSDPEIVAVAYWIDRRFQVLWAGRTKGKQVADNHTPKTLILSKRNNAPNGGIVGISIGC